MKEKDRKPEGCKRIGTCQDCQLRKEGRCQLFLNERNSDRDFEVLTDTEWINVKVSDKDGYGIAIDLGTTTLVAELVELASGKIIASEHGINHQRSYGTDVISRIESSNQGEKEQLQHLICLDLRELILKLISYVTVSAIKKIVLVGNTTMIHLLRGLSCETMGREPFLPADDDWYKTDAGEFFGIPSLVSEFILFPCISAFIGGDVLAGIYAREMILHSEKSLLLDIGTNGEIAFWNGKTLRVASTAAGPVFEGGHISCGVPSIEGAIAHAKEKEGTWEIETIHKKEPCGICGTGIIDVIAQAYKSGWMDCNGTLFEPWFSHGIEVIKGKIKITQKDIREVQMAKAAIRAGIEILCVEEPQEVYLSGGYGQTMDVENAVHIGLCPKWFEKYVIRSGNTALAGAKRFLLEEDGEEKINRICKMAEEVNLAKNENFEELYVEYMSLPL